MAGGGGMPLPKKLLRSAGALVLVVGCGFFVLQHGEAPKPGDAHNHAPHHRQGAAFDRHRRGRAGGEHGAASAAAAPAPGKPGAQGRRDDRDGVAREAHPRAGPNAKPKPEPEPEPEPEPPAHRKTEADVSGPSYAVLYTGPDCTGEELRIDRGQCKQCSAGGSTKLCGGNWANGKLKASRVTGKYELDLYEGCEGLANSFFFFVVCA